MASHFRRPRAGTVLLSFLYVWLMVGFFTGTMVLVGPARWLSEGVQKIGWAQSSENLALSTLIILYIIASFFLSRWLLQRMYTASLRPLRLGVPAFVTVAALLSAWAWSNPGAMLAGLSGGGTEAIARSGEAEFIFGAYPDAERLRTLKKQGVHTIISLQHPSLPVEAPGIYRERDAVRDIGIELVHLPMLPWVSDNRTSLNRLREIARTGSGKYYVHCGLGRDRVNLARRAIEEVGTRTTAAPEMLPALTLSERQAQLDRGEIRTAAFERGAIIELEMGVWLIPQPNAHEMAGYLLSGQIARVVSVYDSLSAEANIWQEEAKALFSEYDVPASFHSLSPGDTARAEDIVANIRGGQRPVVIIVPETHQTTPQLSPDPAATLLSAYPRWEASPHP